MRYKYIIAACSVCFISLLSASMPAIAQINSVPVSLSLSALTPGKKVDMLRSGHETAQITWIVPSHYVVQNPTLQIRYLTSPETTMGSQLVVSMDHKIVGAISLNPQLPRGSFTVSLGHQTFSAGRHFLQIQAIPGPAAAPPKTSPPKSWTQIDYSASQLIYTQQRLPWRHLDFAHLPMILNESEADGSLALPIRFYETPNPTLLTAAQEAVAGMALRTGAMLHVAVHVVGTGDALPTPGIVSSDVSVWLTPAADLPGLVHPYMPITGPTVLLVRNPDNPLGIVVVFTGTNNAQVLEAARAFAVNRNILPLDHRWNVIATAQMTDMNFGPQNAVYPGQVVSLHALQGSHSVLNTPHGTADINFWLPGGLFASRQSKLKMKLTMATKPLTKPITQPIITVMANNHWISQWKLTPGVANYQTTIPFSALVGGENHVTFQIAGGQISIFPDSTLQLPTTHRYMVLPDLALFQHTGFPLVVNGVGHNLSLWYSESNPASWSAGLTLFGLLVQSAHSPLPSAKATLSMPTKGNVLAVGTLTSVPTSWLSASPIRLQHAAIHWQMMSRRSAIHPWLGAQLSSATAYLVEAHTPYKNHVAVTFLATNTQNLQAAAWHLAATSSWNQLKGDFAWQNREGLYQSTMVGPHFMYGNRQNGWFWIFLFSKKPWLWVLAGSAVILLATLPVWIFTLRKKAQWRAEDAL